MITSKVLLLGNLDIINDNQMTEKELLKKLGLKIKQIRTEKGISQLALGIDIEVEKSNISRMESGRVNPKIYTLYKVSQALNISLSELVELD